MLLLCFNDPEGFDTLPTNHRVKDLSPGDRQVLVITFVAGGSLFNPIPKTVDEGSNSPLRCSVYLQQ